MNEYIAGNEFFKKNFKKSVSIPSVKTRGKKMPTKKSQSSNSAKLNVPKAKK
jgi:hypothetical protein